MGKSNASTVAVENDQLLNEIVENENEATPEEWTLISALDFVLENARNSKLNKEFWTECDNALNFLTEKLELSKVQCVFLAIFIEREYCMSWASLGKFIGCSRLSAMVHSDEIEGMEKKGWLIRGVERTHEGSFEGFKLTKGVVTALRHNTSFVPEKLDGLTLQQFISKLKNHYNDYKHRKWDSDFKFEEEWMLDFCKINAELPLCKAVLSFKNKHTQSLFLLAVFDYANSSSEDDEGLAFSEIEECYDYDLEFDLMASALNDLSHELIVSGYIENKCEDGIVNPSMFVLTKKTKENLLSDYKRFCFSGNSKNQFLKSHSTINAKELFFNKSEQTEIDRLTSMLNQENLQGIQQRLESQGMRKGFACLFYGGPGTGKTETVLQIARETGRDIMQIDIAGLRDKFVGESEKNIKAVFSNYKDLCKSSEIMPILFFNEADAIFNKRSESVYHAVDKMENAMQNIILQELEDLDGILIATTNLTSNLDSAFERRFLFKIEFHKPDISVKAKIWNSMMKNLSNDDAQTLASKFDLSGGQIENRSRKSAIDYILTGEYPPVATLESYCYDELLNSKGGNNMAIGFRK